MSAVLAVDAKETLHERGFPRAVFAHEGVHGSLFHRQGDAVQRLYAGKRLGDVRHLQEDLLIVQCRSLLFLILHSPSPAGEGDRG